MDTYDPWVVMAAMAMRTSRVRLGAIITPPARSRPWKLAREALSVDRRSDGRLVLPVGLGALDDAAFENVGEPTDARTRAALLDETLAILDGLWRGKPFGFRGEHYRFEPMTFLPTPVQRPRIPIWVVGAWRTDRTTSSPKAAPRRTIRTPRGSPSNRGSPRARRGGSRPIGRAGPWTPFDAGSRQGRHDPEGLRMNVPDRSLSFVPGALFEPEIVGQPSTCRQGCADWGRPQPKPPSRTGPETASGRQAIRVLHMILVSCLGSAAGLDGQRGVKTQSPVVERPPDDGAGTADRSHGDEILDRGDPGRGDDRPALEGHESLVQGQVRAAEGAVPIDRGHFECRDADVREGPKGILDRSPGRAVPPSVADRLAISDVEGYRESFWPVRRDQRANERRIAQGGRADDGPGSAPLENRADSFRGPQAAGHLDSQSIPDLLDEGRDHGPMVGCPTPRGIEVDDVEPTSAGLRERQRDGDGIVREGGLAIEVTLLEADDTTAAQIDGGQDREVACPFRRSVVAF